jgi:hypothetical protein
MKKILSIILILVSVTAYTQNTSTKLVEKYYTSEETSVWVDPDTIPVETIVKQYIQVKVEDKIMILSVLGEYGLSFFLEKYVSTSFEVGVSTSLYSGQDEGGKPVFVYYIVSDDFTREAILIEGSGYGATYYMGLYK